MNTFELSRAFFDYCTNNPDKIKTGTIALYYFIIDHSNRLGWPEKFGLPSQYAMTIIGISRHQTYYSYLSELEAAGFINVVEKSRNQYNSTIISLVNGCAKNATARAQAIVEHAHKRWTGTRTSDGSIIKHKTINIKHKHTNNNKVDSDEQNLVSDKIDFEKLINFFNETFSKSVKVFPEPIKKKYLSLLKKGYSKEDIIIAMRKAAGDQFHIENGYKHLTLEFFSRPDKVEKFSTMLEPKPEKHEEYSLRKSFN